MSFLELNKVTKVYPNGTKAVHETSMNVEDGEFMVFVGPRPDVPKYVDTNDDLWKNVLVVTPGFTDPTIIRLRNEEELLAQISDKKESFYKEVLLPFKLKGHINYINERNALKDLYVIFYTIFCVLFPRHIKTPTMEEIKGLK